MPCNWLPKCSAAAATSEAGGPVYSYALNGRHTAEEGQEHWSPPVACLPS